MAALTRRPSLATFTLALLTVFAMSAPSPHAQDGTWTTKEPMPTARYGSAAGVIDGKLYVATGIDATGERTAVTEVHDPVSDTWTSVAPIPFKLYSAGVGAIGTKLYVAGGQPWPQLSGESINIDEVQIYDALTNSWSAGTPMPSGGASMAGAVIDGKLYLATGRNPSNTGNVNTLRVYTPSASGGSWDDTKAPIPTAREFAAAGVVDGQLYVVGGKSGSTYLGTVEAYDPALNAWRTKASMATPRAQLTVAVVQKILYAFGGVNAAGTKLTTVEAFDPAAGPLDADGEPIGAWMTLDPMPDAHTLGVADVIDGVAFVVGGIDANGRASAVNHALSRTPEDKTAPELFLPNGITEEATSAAGAVVDYIASAHDDVDGAIAPSCTPESG